MKVQDIKRSSRIESTRYGRLAKEQTASVAIPENKRVETKTIHGGVFIYMNSKPCSSPSGPYRVDLMRGLIHLLPYSESK